MQNRILKVNNEAGLHARPAAELVKEAGRFESSIEIRGITHPSAWVDAKSILSVLSLGVERGHEIEVRTNGADEVAAMTALVGVIGSDFSGRI
jgi:phosphotransferase system HPr (HPr) family protein